MPVGAKGIRAARAFVELYLDDKLPTQLKKAQRTLRRSAAGFITAGKIIGVGVATPLSLIAGSALKAAGDAEEILNKFNQTFGKQAGQAAGFAEDLADRIGRSSTKVKESLAEYQAFFVGLGFAPDVARGLAQEIQQLSLDFASFNNLSDGEGQRRMISALAGSSEVLDRFGVNTKEAALQQELLDLGLAKTVRSATEQQKVAARLSIIMRSLTSQGAVGDAERTQGSFQNSLKRLNGVIFETRRAIGEALLPVATRLVRFFAGVTEIVGKWAKENPTLVRTIVLLGGALVLVGGTLLVVGLGFALAVTAIGGFIAVIGVVSTVVTAALGVVASLGTVVGGLAAVVVVASAAVGTAFVAWLAEATTVFEYLKARFVELKDFTVLVFGGIADALSGGDLTLAAEIAWNGVRVVWIKGVNAVLGVTDQLANSMVLAITNASAMIARVIARMVATVDSAIESAIAGTTKFVQEAGVAVGFYTREEADALNRFEEGESKKRQKAIENAAAAKIREANENQKIQTAAIFAGEEQRLAQRTEVLNAAREDLKKSTDEAKMLAQSVKNATDKDFTAGRGGILAELEALLSGSKKSTLRASGEVRSTFSLAEARRFGSGRGVTPEEKTARAAERMLEEMRDIARGFGALQNLVTFS